MLDFNKIQPRNNTNSSKWDKYAGTDILPLWVADMDFQIAAEIRDALQQEVQRGIFGYNTYQSSVTPTVINYVSTKYNWSVDSSAIVWLPGLVPGLNLAAQILTTPDEAVITATPIYPPFMSAPKNANRELICVPLRQEHDQWQWDFAKLEHAIVNAPIKPKLLLLCNPHNPVGRVWTRNELEHLLDIVIKYDLLVCSDEIHCDLILDDDKTHIPFAALNEHAAARTVTLMAPSKTYNLAGLNCSYAIITNPQIRDQFRRFMRGLYPSELNTLGLVACQAALKHGQQWLQELLTYLRDNRDWVIRQLAPIAGLNLTTPEATYLLWIDGREFCNRHKIANLQQYFEKFGVGLSDGADFGIKNCVRMNLATSRSLLEQAVSRIIQACSQ